MGRIWHIGIAVPDLAKGQQELRDVFGLRWRPAGQPLLDSAL